MVPISHPEGIPRWFSRVFHWWSAWYCARHGHDSSRIVCAHCGQVFDVALARYAGVRV